MGRKAKRGRLSAGNGAVCFIAAITCLGCRAAPEGSARSPLTGPALPTAGTGVGGANAVNPLLGVGFGAAGVMAATGPAGALGLPAAGRGAGQAGNAGQSGSASVASLAGGAAMGAAAGSGGRGPAANSGGSLGQAGTAGASVSSGETGRMAGMTAAHNAVRAMVQTTPALPPMVWSPTLAAYAQEWTDNLANTACAQPQHRSSQELQAKGYGENLAVARGSRPPMTTAQIAVDGWAGEVACWTYGTFAAPGSSGTEQCDPACYQKLNSDGCGHYTQVVWRNSTQLGCGVSSCTSGGVTYDIWICNYAPPGNVVGQKPY